jgi:hypothetical protein
VALSQHKANSQPVVPGLIWVLIALPLIGGAGDLVMTLRRSRSLSLSGSIVPLLLILFGVVAALLAGAVQRRRRRSIARMPTGVWQAVLQEGGWRFSDAESAVGPLREWSEMVAVRQGDRSVVLICLDGFYAIPATALTREQSEHLHRLVARKLRPSL